MTPPDPPPAAARPTWIWPVRLPARTAAQLYQATHQLGDRLGRWPRWLLAGALSGALPLLVDVVCGVPVSHVLTAVLLLPLLVAAVAHDAAARGLGAIGAAF